MVDPNEFFPLNRAEFLVPLDKLKPWKALCVVLRSGRSNRARQLFEHNFVKDQGKTYVLGRFLNEYNELSVNDSKTLVKVVAHNE